MIPFSSRPPKESTGYNFDIIRCPPAGKLRAVITSDNLVGCPTHFYRGQTVPCSEQNCQACDEGMPWRWHGYVTIFTAATHFHQLLELTAPPAETLATYRDQHGTLRGCEVILNRVSPRPNGRVRIQTKPLDLTQLSLPQAPDLRLILATVWNLPQVAAEVRGLLKNHPQFHATEQPTLPDDHGPHRLSNLLMNMKEPQCKSPNGSRGD